jgi:hypothetical protein
MKGYELSRVWFAYAYDRPEKFTPIDTALYFWIVEVFNRARWPEKIYLPSSQAMQHIGCKSYKAYINSFNKLEAEGFIIVAERSKNQYTANIIALVSEAKALTEASTKATTNASTEAHTEPSTKASTVYKNIEHTTKNIEQFVLQSEICWPENFTEDHKKLWLEYEQTRESIPKPPYSPAARQLALNEFVYSASSDPKKYTDGLQASIRGAWVSPKWFAPKVEVGKQPEVKKSTYDRTWKGYGK